MPTLKYRGHVQNKGWTEWLNDGETCGTVGESLRLEAIEIKIEDGNGLGVEYSAQIENKGWIEKVSDGATCGTVGESLRLEAIKINLTGSNASQYDIFYSVQAENFAWMDWTKDGEPAGTEGYSYRAEAVRITLVAKGDIFESDTPETERQITQEMIDKVVDSVNESIKNGTLGEMASEHFAWSEYACDCIRPEYMFGWCNGYPSTNYSDHSMQPEIVQKIELLRQRLDCALYITSAIRCEQCNSYWGGVSDSLHKIGEAVDLYSTQYTPQQIADIAYHEFGFGVIIYSTFVHLQLYPRYSYGSY